MTAFRVRLATIIVPALLGLILVGCGPKKDLTYTYEILVNREFKEPERVKEDQTFYGGEKIRFEINADQPGYFYVFDKTPDGQFVPLYPHPKVNGGSAFVKQGVTLHIPSKGSFQFDNKPGIETLYLCFSDKPVPALDAVIHGHEKDTKRIDMLLHRLETEGQRAGTWSKQFADDKMSVQLTAVPADKDVVAINRIRIEHQPMDKKGK